MPRKVVFIYLDGVLWLLMERTLMKKYPIYHPTLLESQYLDLEPPRFDEQPLEYTVNEEVVDIVNMALKDLAKRGVTVSLEPSTLFAGL
jgi:gluconate kinase